MVNIFLFVISCLEKYPTRIVYFCSCLGDAMAVKGRALAYVVLVANHNNYAGMSHRGPPLGCGLWSY